MDERFAGNATEHRLPTVAARKAAADVGTTEKSRLTASYGRGSLLPVIPVEASILDGFREVLRADAVNLVQIRDGAAGDFQNAIVRPRGEAPNGVRPFRASAHRHRRGRTICEAP